MATESGTKPALFVPAMAGFYESVSGLAYPLVRFVTGLFLIPHGGQKLLGWWGGSINGTAGFFSNIGLEPAVPLAYLVGFTELVGGICIAIGLFTRIFAAAVVIEMAVAILAVHLSKGFFVANGGFEYALLWGLVALAIFFRGGGELSVDRTIGKEF